jgi:ketosteroid isomerase-like protein
MTHSRYLPLAPLALLSACGTGADPDDVLQTVRLVEQSELAAIAADDVNGVVRNYNEKAVLVVPGSAPASGTTAIRSAFEGMLADPNLAVELTPGPGWAATSGDLAVTTATLRMTTTDKASGQKVSQSLSNQTVWHKTDGAPWQIVSDYNAALPEAATAAAPPAAQ